MPPSKPTHTHTHTCKQSQCVSEVEVSETPSLKSPLQLWTSGQLTAVCGSLLHFSSRPHQPCLLFFYVSMKQACNFHSCVLELSQRESGKESAEQYGLANGF